jgi:hypothetical protein
VNINDDVLDWSGPSPEVIALRPVLMYYAIKIDSSLFFWDLSGGLPGIFQGLLDVDLSSLFIVGEPPHRV